MLEMLTGAALLAAGWMTGRFVPARRRPPKQPKPVCGCGHEIAYHDPKTSECHGRVEEATKYDPFGSATAWKRVQCTCRQYDGPTPLPTIYAPEVTG